MSQTILYTNDENTTTGIREASFEEIVGVAREQRSRRVRRFRAQRQRATTLKLGSLEREVFAVIFPDKRHRLISYQEMFQGTIEGASVTLARS
jgi:DNA repair protein RadC